MKKLCAAFAVILMFSVNLFGGALFNTMAEEPAGADPQRYYTSIEIQEGDSLWSLAKTYNTHQAMDMKSYVKELKQMNGLKQDTIHAGQYLTVVYFTDDV